MLRLFPLIAIAVSLFFSSVAFCQAADEKTSQEKAEAEVWKFEDKLAALPDEKARIPLVREFFDKLQTPQMKIAAIGMMNYRYVFYIPLEIYPELLGKLLRDENLQVRASAAGASGYTGTAIHFEKELRALLKETDVWVKQQALYGMGHGGDERFLADIAAYLSHSDPRLRQVASFELSILLPNTQSHYAHLMSKQLNDPDKSVRARAVHNLHRNGARRYSNEILQLLAEDTDAGVLEAAIETLQTWKVEAAIPHLAKRLDDASPGVKGKSALALASFKADAFIPQVLALSKNENVQVRCLAAQALALFGTAATLPRLHELLQDPDDRVRKQTLEAMRANHLPTA